MSETFSICMANRGPTLGVWATIHACEAQLRAGLFAHEYCVFTNGRLPDEPLLNMRNAGILLGESQEALPPPIARNKAAEMASNLILAFFDDHCIPGPRWFEMVATALRKYDVVHTSYQTFLGGPRYFHYSPLDTETMRGDYATEPQSWKPYACKAGPHGGWAIRRKDWESLGGYGDWYDGFGGEETYFDLKAWAHGMTVGIEPNALYWHYSVRDEVRGYERPFNPANFERSRTILAPFMGTIQNRWEKGNAA